MPVWAKVQDHLRQVFDLDRDEEWEVSLTLQHHSLGQLRAQRVMVRHYDHRDVDMIEVRSAFCRAEDVAAGQALERNLKLPIGAIAKHGDYLVVVHRVAIKHCTLEGIVFYITRVAEVADWLEERRGGDRF